MPIIKPKLPESAKKAIYWSGLYGSSLSLAIQCSIQEYAGIIVVITPDSLTASRLENELKFFAELKNLPILNFPDWETLPYDNFSPHQDIISQRLVTLNTLLTTERGVLVVPISTLMQRLMPRAYLEANVFNLHTGDKFNLDQMRLRLERSGYRHVEQVMEHGEYAGRGSLFDLFPMGSNVPFRIDLFDNEIDSIRTFDPDTQRSIEKVPAIHLLPAREFPLTEDAITCFRQKWRDIFPGNPINCPIYQDISQGISSPGIEYYLSLFFQAGLQTLFDYLPCNSLFIGLPDIVQAAETIWTEINERHLQRCNDITRPILSPQLVFMPVNELFAAMNTFPLVKIVTEGSNQSHDFKTLPPPALLLDNKKSQPLQTLVNYLTETTARVLICAETAGRRESLLDLFNTVSISPKIVNSWQEFLENDDPLALTIAPLEQGLCLTSPPLTLITEPQLFGQQVMQRRRRTLRSIDSDAIVKNLAELSVGAPVVHIDHGVGRYLGLQTITVGDREAEYLTLEYAGEDKLYVPVSSLHLISRYSGVDIENAPLHRLGTEQWTRAKNKAATEVRDVAAELLDIYAKRAARHGHAFRQPDNQYSSFAQAFPFETTPDQQQAIDQVIADMTLGKPMDRLVCGDVGFGKTEVAMRAAFLAIQDGKQVAILVPTTLLANQHYQNFKDRFADWPINVEMISRFRSAAEQTNIIKQLKENKIDILIGTHKLLQQNIEFKALGLVIIDEEHRFGVQQKDRLKELRTEVDILTLTATPIPRTLNFALSGIRELSIIATPPARRLSIKTFVREYDLPLIREAILREVMRGGQVYFLHNVVDTIHKMAEDISQLIPEAKVNVAHGQMRERELEQVMVDFYHHRFNVLLCTTIIESGIDIPTANTIIINRADRLGLAQLHQLRGRVGRSHHQAYAYLLTPPKNLLTTDAEKRLAAISSLEDLGAGFTLATHDLEIRGAGEFLGEAQSGNMQAIGFSLYMELLERTVAALKAGKEPAMIKPLSHGAEIDLQFTALIPATYLPDVHTRLTLYKRIANAADQESLKELQIEMIDRFGLLPEAAKNLFLLTELKLKANSLGIRKIETSGNNGRIEFDQEPNIEPKAIIHLIQTQPQQYRLDGPTRLRFTLAMADKSPQLKVQTLATLLEKIAKH